MLKFWKNFLVLVLSLGLFYTGTDLNGEPFCGSIQEIKDETCNWSIDTSQDNWAAFGDDMFGDALKNGSINVVGEKESELTVALNVEFAGDYQDATNKKDSLLTVTFSNMRDKASSEADRDFAEIYAKSINGSAVGVSFDAGINVKFEPKGTKYPLLMAVAEIKVGGDTDNDGIDATCLRVANDANGNQSVEGNGVTIAAPSALISKAVLPENVDDGEAQNGAAAVIGQASTSDQSVFCKNSVIIKRENKYWPDINKLCASANVNGDASSAVIGLANSAKGDVPQGISYKDSDVHLLVSGNEYLASSDSKNGRSASAVVGIASTARPARIENTSGYENIWELGVKNILSSSAFSDTNNSAAIVIGVANSKNSKRNAEILGENKCEIGDNNTLVACSSGGKVAAAAVFGAVSCMDCGTNGDTVGSRVPNTKIDLFGDQTICALACGGTSKIDVFGADLTDGDSGESGWNVGIHELSSPDGNNKPAIVNIFGAKLAERVNFEQDANGDSIATITLDSNQGNDQQTYTRAFALGQNFQIEVGDDLGNNLESPDEENVPEQPSGAEGGADVSSADLGIMNIFGAVAPARCANLTDDKRCQDSKFTVNKGWTVNAFDPLEGLNMVIVKDGGTLNVFGPMKDLTLTDGVVNVLGHHKGDDENTAENAGVGKIILKNGVLRIGARTNVQENVKGDLEKFFDKIKIVNPQEEEKLCKVKADYSAYVNRFCDGGVLELKEGDEIVFYVDSTKNDPNVVTNGSSFQLVKGCIEIEKSAENSNFSGQLRLQGGHFSFVDDSGNNSGGDQANGSNSALMFVRCPGLTVQEAFGNDVVDKVFEEIDPKNGVYRLVNAGSLLAGDVVVGDGMEIYAKDGIGLGLMTREDLDSIRKVTLSTDEGVSDDDFLSAPVCINGKLAKIDIVVASMLRGAVGPRLTDVKGNGDDPFISVIGGHVHQNQVSGAGYSGDLCGLAGGADKLYRLDDSSYVRLGALVGYIYGDIDFCGSAAGDNLGDKQDNYLLAAYGAYESFNEHNLKTDFNICFGFGYGEHKLSRSDAQKYYYDAKMKSNSVFIHAEYIKNLYSIRGVQFGLWLKANYHHTHQKRYKESSSNGGAAVREFSKVNSDSLNTTVGVNIEKELHSALRADSRLRLFMRAGWNCQPLRNHSTLTARTMGTSFHPDSDFCLHDSFIISAGFREKFNTHWDVVAEWNGSYNKRSSNNIVSLSLGYSF